MAATALTEEDCKEYFDEPEELKGKIKKLAELVKRSQHFVAFTGAGISTSAGIADFRSGINTVLDTGAGAWTKKAAKQKGQTVKTAKRKVSTLKAYPTPSHMALLQLMKSGHLKYLISQNTDGLHRRSGIPPSQLSELHGNSTLEKCAKCNKEYLRDYHCRNRVARKQSKKLSDEQKIGRYKHMTGRYCTVIGCNGDLQDSVVAFGEHLPFDPLALAQQNSDKADLYLSLGSSLGVTPARDMPKGIGKKWLKEKRKKPEQTTTHNLVIVNLQKTPLHGKCSLPIFAKIDDVMIGLMNELGLIIPHWNLQRYIKVSLNANILSVCGVDSDGTPFEVFRKITLLYHKKEIKAIKNDVIAFEYVIPKNIEKGLNIWLEFYKNYKEVDLLINLNDLMPDLMKNDGKKGIILQLMFDPRRCKWNKPQIWNENDELMDLKNVCLMQLYKTSYGYDGKNALLFGNNKKNESLLSPQKITKYINISSNKCKILWIDGKTGKEDLATYTTFYHQFGLLYCYYFDYYVPQIRIKILNKIMFTTNDNIVGDEFGKILYLICEYEGVCNLLNDFIRGDFMNPYPFHKNLMIQRMFQHLNEFSNEWQEFINTYSSHRQVSD